MALLQKEKRLIPLFLQLKKTLKKCDVCVFYECGNKISFPNKMRDGGDGDSDEDYDDFQTS